MTNNPDQMSRGDLPLILVPYSGYGKSSHFYHFLLSYFLPVFAAAVQVPSRLIAVQDCGPLNRWWTDIPGLGNVKVLTFLEMRDELRLRTAPQRFSILVWSGRQLLRLFPASFLKSQRRLYLATKFFLRSRHARRLGIVKLKEFEMGRGARATELTSIALQVKGALGLQEAEVHTRRRRIVVIDRSLVPDFYIENEGSDYGPVRRTIPNMTELVRDLEKLGEVNPLRTEELAIGEVIREISRADVLVGQHGAGLANMVWMNPSKIVIEISHVNQPGEHFPELASLMSLTLRRIVGQESAHAPVDLKKVSDCVEKALSELSMVENAESQPYSS